MRIGSASTLVTVRIAVPEVKPLRLAVIVLVWLTNSKVLSVTAETAKVAEDAPSAMVTEEGTVASVVSLETNVIANPLAGATRPAGRETVPVEALAPAFSATVVGLRETLRTGVVTVPVTATVGEGSTPAVARVMEPLAAPTVALADTRTWTVVAATDPPSGEIDLVELKEVPSKET